MGCSQCDTIEEPANDNDLEELKDKMNEEYTSYLIFLKNLKEKIENQKLYYIKQFKYLIL